MSLNASLLEIQELRTYYYVTSGTIKAVDGVSLNFKKSIAYGLVGESGCGKSTIAFSILRLVPSPGRIVGGRILYKNKDLLNLNENEMRNIRGREISIVFQDPMTFLNPIMKIGDQIAEVIKLHQNVEKEDVDEMVIETLRRVRMPSPSSITESYPHQLSGGMRQRVIVAIATSCNPSLIILDEPTTALDVTIQAQILELIKNMIDELKMSVLLITHNLGIISEICDEVYIMYAGKIVEYGDIFNLFEESLHPYTAGLLESVISIDEFKKEIVSIPGNVPDLSNPPSGCKFHPRCKHAMPVCQKKEPPSMDMGSNHKVYCWLYG